MWQKTGSGNEEKPGFQIINEGLFFSGASLCFGQTKTLLCEAKTSRRSHYLLNANSNEMNPDKHRDEFHTIPLKQTILIV